MTTEAFKRFLEGCIEDCHSKAWWLNKTYRVDITLDSVIIYLICTINDIKYQSRIELGAVGAFSFIQLSQVRERILSNLADDCQVIADSSLEN